ncbi:hypothetical protein GOP47_0004372 [Adiantum capillus-veneris]|uniref:Uncharacterized protein n=1 Tax=Adiantum capillus-veneris TaxID=13818 RepID=A0A9D4ZMS7_ADICA|nr:hypothetical protein GOP47_0004372 [Adiantum capillus-veneris]
MASVPPRNPNIGVSFDVELMCPWFMSQLIQDLGNGQRPLLNHDAGVVSLDISHMTSRSSPNRLWVGSEGIKYLRAIQKMGEMCLLSTRPLKRYKPTIRQKILPNNYNDARNKNFGILNFNTGLLLECFME